jgi:hypothetical protein
VIELAMVIALSDQRNDLTHRDQKAAKCTRLHIDCRGIDCRGVDRKKNDLEV